MKKTKKIVSVIFALLMVVSIIPMSCIETKAATSVTADQAIAWCQSNLGKALDYDGCYGAQCVDLIMYYYKYLGVSPVGGNGCDYATNALPSGAGWTRTKGGVPQKGDILVYVGGAYGHVAIHESTNFSYHQNWNGQYVRRINRPYNQGYTYQGDTYYYWGCIHPKFADSVSTTGITLNSSPFTLKVGESKTLSATVSPSNATNKTVTWSSNDTSVATVSSSGVVKAVGTGACAITAKASGGQTASVTMVVRNESPAPVAYATYNGHYYELYDDVLSWKDAKEYCESIGGHLVTITSQEENNFIQTLASNSEKEHIYIGTTDEATEGTWKWVTEESFSYSNFGDGEPSETEYDVEDYVRLSSSTGKWHDVRDITGSVGSCGFICEYEAPIKPDAVTVIDGKVYELYDREYPITLAENFANDNNGDLLTVNSENEQNAVASWIQANSSTKYVALGAYADSNRIWHWSNGDKWSYDNWRSGEPNNTNNLEDGATIVLSDYGWNDVSRTNAYVFVVEYSLEEWENNGNSLEDLVFEELPEGADPDDYELVTEYRSRDMQTTTSTSSTLEGWTLYNSESTYGSWSSVQSTQTKPTESDTLQITGTWKQYHYYHYCNYYDNQWNIDSIPCGSSSVRHDTYLNQKLPAFSFQDQGGQQAYGGQGASGVTACDYNFYVWFYAGEKTFYNYQTRTKTTTNHFYKWSDWSDWTETPIASTDSKQVETRVGYRLKDNNEPDNPNTPDTPNIPDIEFVFSIKQPSRTTIRNKDGIVLHSYIEGTAPKGSYVDWSWNNSKFDVEKNNDGTLTIISENNGKTTFTATFYDANGEILAMNSIEMTSKAGFFDKIGGFFRSLFGATKIYEN